MLEGWKSLNCSIVILVHREILVLKLTPGFHWWQVTQAEIYMSIFCDAELTSENYRKVCEVGFQVIICLNKGYTVWLQSAGHAFSGAKSVVVFALIHLNTLWLVGFFSRALIKGGIKHNGKRENNWIQTNFTLEVNIRTISSDFYPLIFRNNDSDLLT